MMPQITKDTKFKDLPDGIKVRIINLSKKMEPLAPSNGYVIDRFGSIYAKLSGLGLSNLKETFEQCMANCEAYKEGYEPKPEEIQKNIDNELKEIKERLTLYIDSQFDNDLLLYMYETISILQKKVMDQNRKSEFNPLKV